MGNRVGTHRQKARRQSAPQPQTKQRTLVRVYKTYEQADKKATALVNEGTPAKQVQVRRRADGFGVYLRRTIDVAST